MPEKSGMDAALCAPLPVGPPTGVSACPKAAVTEAATAANVANKRKSHRRTPMATSLSWFRRHLLGNATAVAGAPERGARCLHLAQNQKCRHISVMSAIGGIVLQNSTTSHWLAIIE